MRSRLNYEETQLIASLLMRCTTHRGGHGPPARVPQGNVRQMAAWALGEMKTRLGVESLAAVLVNDHSEGVRQMAAWALGEIGHKDALDALKTALNDQNQQVRTTAKWALSEIND